MRVIFRRLVLNILMGLAVMPAERAVAEPHVGTGLTLELAADVDALVPGRTINLAVLLKPDAGFHTYWRQPGLVGLTPTVEWSLPEGVEVGELLWPEPQRGKMAAYGVWCLKRQTALVAPMKVPESLDPSITPHLTLKAKLVWMACGRTCHPGAADLSLTLPVRAAGAKAPSPTAAAQTIALTLQEQAGEDARWKFTAIQQGEGGGFSLTVTPPPGEAVPADAYFYGYQRLVDSNVDPVRHELAGGSVRLDLALVEEPDRIPAELLGELWTAQSWPGQKGRRLLKVKAPLSVQTAAPGFAAPSEVEGAAKSSEARDPG